MTREQSTTREPLARSADRIALALTLAGLAAAVVLAIRSDGIYHDDDLAHCQFAMDGWSDPAAMLYWWARPGYNIPAMFVARVGDSLGGGEPSAVLLACRIFSALQTAAVAYIAYRIARRLLGPTRPAALVPALVWVQPLVMTLAITTLTETPAALYLTLAVWLYVRGNRVWACVAMSLTFVTRIEMLALAPIFVGGVIVDALRRADWNVARAMRTPWLWAAAAGLLWAPGVYVLATLGVDMPPGGDPLMIFSRPFPTEYGSGSWGHMLAAWVLAAGLGTLVLALAGALRLGRRAWLVTSLTFGLAALHTVLFRFGLFASGGYARFLVPVGGLLAVLGAAGLDGLWRPKKKPVLLAACLAPLVWFWLGMYVVGARRSQLDTLAPAYPILHAGLRYLPLVMTVSAVAIVAAVPVLILVLRKADSARMTRLGRTAAVAMVVVAAVQAAVQVRPLMLDRWTLNAAVKRAIAHVADGEHAGSGGLGRHAVAHFFRRETQRVWSNEDAVRRWREADGGVLFFWDNKYCCKPQEAESGRLLYDELNRLGERIYRATEGTECVEVYVRTSGPKERRP